MKFFGLIAVVIVLGVGLFMYQRSIEQLPGGAPQEQIDTVAIRQRLLTIAQAERQYQAGNGKYATLEQLENDNLLPVAPSSAAIRFPPRSARTASPSPQHPPPKTRPTGRRCRSTSR